MPLSPSSQYPIDPNYVYDSSLYFGATAPQPTYNGGQNYYAPVQFQGGYIDFAPDYNPDTNNTAYRYENSLKVNPYYQGQTLNFGSNPNQLPGGGFAGQATQQVNGLTGSVNQGDVLQGYTPPQTGMASFGGNPSTQSYNPQGQPISGSAWTGYQFGNNGSLGSIQGQFGQGALGPTTFFQNQPSSLNPPANQSLGVLQPYNPALHALQTYRSPQ